MSENSSIESSLAMNVTETNENAGLELRSQSQAEVDEQIKASLHPS